MKKSILIIALALAVVSCNKSAEVKEIKTAYVDTSKLLEESTEAKDIEAKYKAKSQEMGKELEAEITNSNLKPQVSKKMPRPTDKRGRSKKGWNSKKESNN